MMISDGVFVVTGASKAAVKLLTEALYAELVPHRMKSLLHLGRTS